MSYTFKDSENADVSTSELTIIIKYLQVADVLRVSEVYELLEALFKPVVANEVYYLFQAGAYAYDTNREINKVTALSILVDWANIYPEMSDANAFDWLRTCQKEEIVQQRVLLLQIGYYARAQNLIIPSVAEEGIVTNA
jgi:hypothetical protein